MNPASASRGNELGSQASAYLLQHAGNPIHWKVWGPGAFERARTDDKPVLVSIGYSTCHWCHVMAHESFEDAEVAEFLNNNFICIKVDREERPDIDALYMHVCQATTGHGGWPLTIFMDADQRPFFAGTYFPRHTHPQRLGFLDLAARLSHVWKTRRPEISKTAADLLELMRTAAVQDYSADLDPEAPLRAAENLQRMFDADHGGFGHAPKFPSPHLYMLLLRTARRTQNHHHLQMVVQSLRAMRAGGIFDQVGFGFHRYSTDAVWHVPHFEKMLYDQAMLMVAFTEAWQASGDPVLRNTVYEIAEFVQTTLTVESGAFASAVDADSGGAEGAFYAFSATELEHISPLFATDGWLAEMFDVRMQGNVDDVLEGAETNVNLLHTKPEWLDNLVQHPEWRTARKQVLEYRSRREHPFTDTKVLADWNGLMIWALANAAKAFSEQEFLKMAETAYSATEVPDHLLDNCAMMATAAITLYQVTGKDQYLHDAVRLATKIRERFVMADGGLRMVSDSVTDIPVAPRSVYDGAYPCGTSMAAYLFAQLGAVLADETYTGLARDIVRSVSGVIKQSPDAMAMMLCVVDFLTHDVLQVVTEPNGTPAFRTAVVAEVGSRFLPHIVLQHQVGRSQVTASDTASDTASGAGVHLCTAAYCESSLTSIAELAERLDAEVQ